MRVSSAALLLALGVCAVTPIAATAATTPTAAAPAATTAPAAAPAATTAPAAAPAATTTPAAPARNYIVFFKEWSAAIDKPATKVIRAAAKAAKADANATVRVTGFADTTGSSQANTYLTELRAQVVADQLQQDGLAADRIKQAAAGSVSAMGTKQESRRVTISVSASP